MFQTLRMGRRAFLNGLAGAGMTLALATAAVPFAATEVAAKPNLANLSPEQLATVQAVNRYFNSITTFEGKFLQTAPDGGETTGYFVIDRPGKMRFRYYPPAQLDITVDGRTVAVDDKAMQSQTLYLLSETPLRFLLDKNINLLEEAVVQSVSADSDFIVIRLQDPGTFVTSHLTLYFDARTTELKQWTVTDDQGFDTTVAIYETKVGNPTNPEWFEINYSKYK
ncbi:outer membrane lipoprotein carrier protein LolA [Pleomorphomonas sp. NRK KF1]|uniref:LolA family protein n=1 Tax=Pleomorphomonas sp. NRK KF1 TaxID=2943000 RepID=UPI002043B0CE|nr:outer membrane lipoprotein carrier protein LolA [Pleomorphomonas sp. NRK KF1]MCM5554743.1 outer membrane lipoprotein carrier protein LolA [Pleomorphomonas sp. NRK KF1]